ncbi:MAG TPA: GH116 family glycosyl-hydrolase, partial [Opitutaceae bacterium]|nr:GH116 family glycosyl-hydrolase [Opitutaceae bacterium]
MPDRLIARREFVRSSVGTLGAIAAAASLARAAGGPGPSPGAPAAPRGPNTAFTGEQLDQIAFPMGGLGAGMMCLEGPGALTNVSIRDRPMLQNQPGLFAAVSIGGPSKVARVVEGPVPRWKLYLRRHAATGSGPLGLGLPRFERAVFRAHFPFARVELADPAVPLAARITAWSPFEPGDADNSSLPVAGLEYTFTNSGEEELDAVFSFNARNFVPAAMNEWQSGPEPARGSRATPGGFTLYGGAWPSAQQEEAWCAFAVDDPAVKVNLAWFRGDWFDPQTMAWRDVEQGAAYDRPVPAEGRLPTGASLFVPFHVLPGASKTIRLRIAWYAPRSRLRDVAPPPGDAAPPSAYYQPWYAGRFASVDELSAYWRDQYADLRRRSERFSDCFLDSTLPPEAVEAAAANLSILKS